MPLKTALTRHMSIASFENNYWYTSELKAFANNIGVPAYSRLRKDQLEIAIKQYLYDGKIISQPVKDTRKSKTTKDYENTPLTPKTIIINYSSDKLTKAFIQCEAKKRQADVAKKSGAWYWLNRWREEQLAKHRKISYGDLVEHFLILCNTPERLPRIPSTKFNNFISDFLSAKAGNRSDATKAWETLKTLDCPKTYNAWFQQKHKATKISAATSVDH